MKVIAHKKDGMGLLYGFVVVMGIFLISLGIGLGLAGIYLWLLGGLICGIGVYYVVKFLMLPSAIIMQDTDGILHLPKGVTVSPADIIDVSYRRASARGLQYAWGSVNIKTHTDEYKYGFVAECEDAAKELTDIMYRARYSRKDGETI